jgi:hypothetical protein
MKIQIKKGKDMNPSDLKEVNKIWKDTFRITYSEMLNYSDDIFFILENNKKILSTGRLRPIEIKFMGKNYEILGIADIASVVKGKGYGKSIMQAMLKYLTGKKIFGIGFCKRDNTLFYRKSGFNIGRDLSKRFLYKDKKGRLIKDEWDDDVIYSNLGNSLFKKIKRNPKEIVWIPMKHW